EDISLALFDEEETIPDASLLNNNSSIEKLIQESENGQKWFNHIMLGKKIKRIIHANN
ncbi:1756_t:CDS:2, partial [Entrophospora sp. SA101]